MQLACKKSVIKHPFHNTRFNIFYISKPPCSKMLYQISPISALCAKRILPPPKLFVTLADITEGYAD